MTHFFEDKDGMRAEVTDNGSGYNLMLDNIHLGNPKTHAFAGVLIPKDKTAQFLAALAHQFGIGIKEGGLVNLRDLPTTAVRVHDNTTEAWYTEGEHRYTISGDIHDIMTDDEVMQMFKKWEPLGLENGGWTPNYWVVDIFMARKPWEEMGPHKTVDFSFDSEGSCFFAYTNDKDDADALAAWINEKQFLR